MNSSASITIGRPKTFARTNAWKEDRYVESPLAASASFAHSATTCLFTNTEYSIV